MDTITVKLRKPLCIRDLSQNPGIPLSLLVGQHIFIRVKHPRYPKIYCYIWQDGLLRYRLKAGISEDYLTNLWENGLVEVNWNGAEPISEKNIIRAA